MHTKVLSSSQLKLLHKLGHVMSNNKFYLAGGTSIAVMLGHRKSVDLDWFTLESMGDPNLWIEKIENENIKLNGKTVEKGTLHTMSTGVRLSLLEYRYPMLHQTVKWQKLGCALASLDDLACMKLSAIAQRGSKKDFVDIYALIKKHKTLKQMLNLYKKKYAGYDIAPVLYGLSYFDDADKERMPRMLWKVTWKTIKKEIQKEFNQYMREIAH